MNKILATLAAVAAFASVPASAVVIVGGNAVIGRDNADGFSNFSILDGNNSISGNATLKTWSIFAKANAGAVRLLIYRTNGQGFDLVGSSNLETPGVAGGVQNFSLGSGLAVQGGDLVGLYFQGDGSVLYSDGGGPVRYTANNAGFANATIFSSDFGPTLSRTYSVSVAGTVPEPATWGLLLVGFGMVGVAARRRSAAVTA
ncbi:MAG: PEPxxWA-CTERM sorting domain-containing protein [Polymorphobacter sp.]